MAELTGRKETDDAGRRRRDRPDAADHGERWCSVSALVLGRSSSQTPCRDEHQHVHDQVDLGGKGGKDRLCYVGESAQQALQAWLAVRGSEPGPLFYAISKGGKLNLKRGAMTDQAKATFKDGVLEITMPAPPEQVRSGRRLEINEGAPAKK